MEIIIGKQGNQPFPITEGSVSRMHAILSVDNSTGKIRLRDNNSTNGTWLLYQDGKFRRLIGEAIVTPETTVRLGAISVYKIKDFIQKKEDKPVDITPLSEVYETYLQTKQTLEAKTSNIMMLRMAALSLGSALGGVFILFLPQDFLGNETISNIVKIFASLISISVAWILVDRKNKGLIRKRSENEAFLKNSYCCPKCGYHFGAKVFTNLLAEGKCPNPNCKCKFSGHS